MSGTQIEPTTPLLVTLQARQWHSLLTAAGEGMNALAGIINEVQRQCTQPSAVVSETGKAIPSAVQRVNGEASP